MKTYLITPVPLCCTDLGSVILTQQHPNYTAMLANKKSWPMRHIHLEQSFISDVCPNFINLWDIIFGLVLIANKSKVAPCNKYNSNFKRTFHLAEAFLNLRTLLALPSQVNSPIKMLEFCRTVQEISVTHSSNMSLLNVAIYPKVLWMWFY